MGAETQGGAGTAGEAREDKGRDVSTRFLEQAGGRGGGRTPSLPRHPQLRGRLWQNR